MSKIMNAIEFKELVSKTQQLRASVLPPLYKPVKLIETDVQLANLAKDQYNRREYTYDGVTVRCAVDASVPSDAQLVDIHYCEAIEDFKVAARGKEITYPKGTGSFRVYAKK